MADFDEEDMPFVQKKPPKTENTSQLRPETPSSNSAEKV
jgi:hypothetical protein